MRKAMFAAFAALAAMVPAAAPGADDPQNEIRELKARIQLLQASLEETRLIVENLRTMAGEDKAAMERMVAAAKAEVERLKAERSDERGMIAEMLESRDRMIADLRERLRAVSSDLERAIGETRDFTRRAEEDARETRAAMESATASMRLAEPVLRRMVESGSAEDRFEAAAALDAADLLDRESAAILGTFLDSGNADERRHAFRFFMGSGRFDACWPRMVNLFFGADATPSSRSEALSLLQGSGLGSLSATAAAWSGSLPPAERLAAAELAAGRDTASALELFAGLLGEGGDIAAKALENLRCATREDFGSDEAGIAAWNGYLRECLGSTIHETLEHAAARRSLREKAVALSVSDLPAVEVAKFLQDVGSVRIAFLSADAGLADVTMTLEDASLEQAIMDLAVKAGAEFAFRAGVCYVGRPGEIAAFDQSRRRGHAWSADAPVAEVSSSLRLESKKLSLDFTDVQLLDVIAFIAKLTRSNLYYFGGRDEDAMWVQLRVDSIPASDALDLILSLKGMSRQTRWGGFAIGAEDRLASFRDLALPEDGPCSELTARLRLVVEDFDISGKTLFAVLGYIADAHGIVVEPEPGLELPEDECRLRAFGISLEQLLNVLLAPRGLAVKAGPDGNKLLVCRAE